MSFHLVILKKFKCFESALKRGSDGVIIIVCDLSCFLDCLCCPKKNKEPKTASRVYYYWFSGAGSMTAWGAFWFFFAVWKTRHVLRNSETAQQEGG